MAGVTAVLDDPVAASLRGPHARLARRHGTALGYLPEVASFLAIPADSDGAWDDLAQLLGPGGFADLFSSAATPPPDWRQLFRLDGFQMVAPDGLDGDAEPAPDLVALGPGDVPEMLALVDRTRPGPFGPRTIEMGHYLGVRDQGRLVAMAGERLHPPGWVEISAVCTAPEARGRGLAAALVRGVGAGIAARGERPFLHVSAANTGAIGLYRRLGFEARRDVVFHGYRVPE